MLYNEIQKKNNNKNKKEKTNFTFSFFRIDFDPNKFQKPLPYYGLIHDKYIVSSENQGNKPKLENKYPDFRFLMNEYHDGILLFDLTDKMVWTKAVQDSIGLSKFYDKNNLIIFSRKNVN